MVLVTVSLATPQKVLPVGELQCFDDWCITVQAVARQQRIGATSAHGVFLVVTTRVSSRARGRRQRETDVYVYVTDYRSDAYKKSAEADKPKKPDDGKKKEKKEKKEKKKDS